MSGRSSKTGFGATLKAVVWSFMGIRRHQDYQQDADSLDPLAVVVAGVLAGLVFVLGLVAFVRYVVGA